MRKHFKSLSSARIIAFGFAAVILVGSLLLSLPCCVKDGVSVSFIDTLYTSASAVCVTGLITVDPGDTFTPLGHLILALLIQTGGLGVASIGTGIAIAIGKKVDFRERNIVRDAMNLGTGNGIVRFVKGIFVITLIFELLGAVLCFPVFVQDYPPLKALEISLFHSVAAFNNSGFDILGNFQSLSSYSGNILLNLVTIMLIFFGGIGFLVIMELWTKGPHWKKYTMHAKVVLTVSAVLIAFGAILLKLTENISWTEAVFQSVSARTAGFSTCSLGTFSNAGLIIMTLLMFVGASPGSTGGGIKTTTLFALIQGIKSSATNKSEKAFRYAMPKEAFRKATVIFTMSAAVVFTGSFLMALMEPGFSIRDILFETVSAFGTVGLTTGITPGLCTGSKILSIIIMYIGRLGPITIATLWYFSRGERVRFPEGNISIG